MIVLLSFFGGDDLRLLMRGRETHCAIHALHVRNEP